MVVYDAVKIKKNTSHFATHICLFFVLYVDSILDVGWRVHGNLGEIFRTADRVYQPDQLIDQYCTSMMEVYINKAGFFECFSHTWLSCSAFSADHLKNK